MWNIQRTGSASGPSRAARWPSITGTTITMAQPCWDNSTKRVVFPDIPGRSVNMVGPDDLTNGRHPAYAENALELLDHARRVVPRPGRPPRLLPAAAGPGPAPRRRRGAGAAEARRRAGHRAGARPRRRVPRLALLVRDLAHGRRRRRASPRSRPGTRSPGRRLGRPGPVPVRARRHLPVRLVDREPAQRLVSHGQRRRVRRQRVRALGGGRARPRRRRQGDLRSAATSSPTSRATASSSAASTSRCHGTPTLTSCATRVTDNHLYGLPREFHGGVGDRQRLHRANTISHNQIDHVRLLGDLDRLGRLAGQDRQPATPNVSHDNAVSDNLIFDYMLMLDDGGGIYTQGITGSSLDDGEKVTGNVIHDQGASARASTPTTATRTRRSDGNVLYDAAYANVGSRAHRLPRRPRQQRPDAGRATTTGSRAIRDKATRAR